MIRNERLLLGWYLIGSCNSCCWNTTTITMVNRHWLKTTAKYETAPIKYHHHNRFMALFPGPTGWAGAWREIWDFMVQWKINRGRHIDHPAGHHSIRTKQCQPPLSPCFFYRLDGCPSCHPTNSVKALKATSTFGLGRTVVIIWYMRNLCFTIRLSLEIIIMIIMTMTITIINQTASRPVKHFCPLRF